MSAKGVKAVVPRSKEANKGPRRTNPWSIHPYRDAYTGVVVVVVPILGQAWVRGGGGIFLPLFVIPLPYFYFILPSLTLFFLSFFMCTSLGVPSHPHNIEHPVQQNRQNCRIVSKSRKAAAMDCLLNQSPKFLNVFLFVGLKTFNEF